MDSHIGLGVDSLANCACISFQPYQSSEVYYISYSYSQNKSSKYRLSARLRF